MKRIMVMMMALVLFLVGCGTAPSDGEAKTPEVDPIVGQWQHPGHKDRRILFLENGMVISVSLDEKYDDGYFGMVLLIDSRGEIVSPVNWCRVESMYVLKMHEEYGDYKENSDIEIKLHGETMIVGYDSDSPMGLNRVPEDEWILMDEIFCTTFDEETSTYVRHPLSELIG